MGLDCKSRPTARHEHPQGREWASVLSEHPLGRDLAVVASVNYKTEDITFSVLDLTFNKILWNCNINETNVGLEYLRITMQGAGSDCIDVSTNQYDYCISQSEEICKKKN